MWRQPSDSAWTIPVRTVQLFVTQVTRLVGDALHYGT
jgi:hypothetical protein